jgi:hypothetical protein
VEVTTVENENTEPKISTRKVEANRENAQKSTGPKTAQGKHNSSHNAMKHGLLSKELVISGKENRKEFEQLLEELIEDFQPQGRAELSLVETIAICDWRFRRTLRAEAAEIVSDPVMAFDRVLPNADETNKILRYQVSVHRQKMQTLQLLEKLQRRRGIPPICADAEPDAKEK